MAKSSTKMAQNDIPATVSIDKDEVAKFSAMAADWWNPNGKFRPLHKFNPIRLDFLRETLTLHFADRLAANPPFSALSGLDLLDIGCGGGLLSEPMARLGANVLGVDASEANIKTASVHAAENNLAITYKHGTAEALLADPNARFDVVLNMEVVEHVANPAQYLQNTAALLKPGGIMVIATINRTFKALALALIGAERILRWLPPGTHDYDKLIKPEEISAALSGLNGYELTGPYGVSYNPLLDKWGRSDDVAINYMMVLTRAGAKADAA